MLILKTLLFTVLAPGTVTVLVPYLLLPARAGLPDTVDAYSLTGALLILLGVAIYGWCAWEFLATGRGTPAPLDPPKALVARGLYRIVRNPMYIGVTTIIVGEAVLFRSTTLLLYAAIVLLIFNLFVMYYEEPTLKRLFGESWEDYRRRVPRWIPEVARRRGGKK